MAEPIAAGLTQASRLTDPSGSSAGASGTEA